MQQIGQYHLLEIIGTGSFSTVYLAENIHSKGQVAIKAIPKSFFSNEEDLKWFEMETKSMMEIDHPLIVSLYEIIESENAFFLVMEYVSSVSLLQMINGREGLTTGKTKKLMRQLLEAIEYLHEKVGIIHRDIKPENILIDDKGNIRLIDFGFAASIDRKVSTMCGSPAYVAPEVIAGGYYTPSVDVWSLGVILYAALEGQLPFYDENVVRQFQLITHSIPEYPKNLDTQCVELLEGMLQ